MTLEEIRAKMAGVTSDRKALDAEAEAAEDGVLPAEQQDEYDRLVENFNNLKRQYDNQVSGGQMDADFDSAPKPVADLLKTTPTGDLPPTQDGTPPPRISSPTQTLRAFKGADAERRAHASGMWVRGTLFGDSDAAQWCRDNGIGKPGSILKTNVNTGAGYLVPEEFSSAIIDNRDSFGIARQFATVVQMSRDTLKVPRLSSGTSASWTGEGATIGTSDPVYDAVNLTAKKLTVLTRVTTEMVDDSAIGLGDWLAMDYARALAEAEDDAMINGDGTSTYGGIFGVKGQMDANESWAGVHTAASGNDTFAEYSVVDLANTMAVLPEHGFAGDPAWYCSRTGWGATFQRLGLAGGGTQAATITLDVRRFNGFDVRLTPKLPTGTGDLSQTTSILFGDLGKAVMLGDRQEMRLQVLSELYAATDEVGFKVTERIDIAAHSLGDGTTAGPLVGLMGD